MDKIKMLKRSMFQPLVDQSQCLGLQSLTICIDHYSQSERAPKISPQMTLILSSTEVTMISQIRKASAESLTVTRRIQNTDLEERRDTRNLIQPSLQPMLAVSTLKRTKPHSKVKQKDLARRRGLPTEAETRILFSILSTFSFTHIQMLQSILPYILPSACNKSLLNVP